MSAIKKRLMSLLALGVSLAAGLGGAYWLHRDSEQHAKKQKRQKQIMPFSEPQAVVRMTLRTEAGQRIDLSRASADTPWRITHPLEAEADQTVVDGMVRHLVDLQYTARIAPEKVEALARFGLASAGPQLRLYGRDGTVGHLLVGKKNSFNGNIYVTNRPPSDTSKPPKDDAVPVFMVPGRLAYQVDKTLFDLRDKQLVDVSPSAVQRFSVTLGEASDVLDTASATLRHYALERDGGRWRLVEPRATRADVDQVDGILKALGRAEAAAFLTADASREALGEWGLDTPDVRVTLQRDEQARVELLFARHSSETSDTQVYATAVHGDDGGPQNVVRLGGDGVLQKLAVSLWALREKRLLPVDRERIAEIELASDGAKLVFEKRARPEQSASPPDDAWHLVAPRAAAADRHAVEGLIYTLTSLRALKIWDAEPTPVRLEETGLAPPQLRATLRDAEGAPLGTLTLGKNKGDGRYARVRGRLPMALVEASKAKDIDTSADVYLPQADTPKH